MFQGKSNGNRNEKVKDNHEQTCIPWAGNIRQKQNIDV